MNNVTYMYPSMCTCKTYTCMQTCTHDSGLAIVSLDILNRYVLHYAYMLFLGRDVFLSPSHIADTKYTLAHHIYIHDMYMYIVHVWIRVHHWEFYVHVTHIIQQPHFQFFWHGLISPLPLPGHRTPCGDHVSCCTTETTSLVPVAPPCGVEHEGMEERIRE